MSKGLRKIALLKDKDIYTLLVLLNSKLGCIQSKDNLDKDIDFLNYNYRVKTYYKCPNPLLNIIYKNNVKRHTTSIINSSGTVADEIGSDIYVVYLKNIIAIKNIGNKILANVNTGTHRTPEHASIEITNVLSNYVTYVNNDMFVILNNLPSNILLIY